MKETQIITNALKRCLHARGMTYRSLGRALSLSESSVKRIFADRSFTLHRLEKICEALDMSIADLLGMTAATRKPQVFSLTLDQERTLASNPSILACFYLLLNGRSIEEAGTRLGLTPRNLRAVLTKLATANLLNVDAKRGVHLYANLPIAWRPDGPVRKLYERQVRAEFLQGSFSASNEALSFHSAELSPASIRILLRKLDRLAADFADLAALDVHVPSRDKTSVAVLLACRPWVFSMFSGYRARSG